MNGWFLVLFNVLGVAIIVGVVYLLLWVIPGPKSLYRLPSNKLLLGTLISFALTLACFTTCISFILMTTDFVLIILIIIITGVLLLIPGPIFLILVLVYKNSITYEEVPPAHILMENNIETNV